MTMTAKNNDGVAKVKRGRKAQSISDRVKRYNATHPTPISNLLLLYVKKGLTLKELSEKYGMGMQVMYNIMVDLGGLTKEQKIEHVKAYNTRKYKFAKPKESPENIESKKSENNP